LAARLFWLTCSGGNPLKKRAATKIGFKAQQCRQRDGKVDILCISPAAPSNSVPQSAAISAPKQKHMSQICFSVSEALKHSANLFEKSGNTGGAEAESFSIYGALFALSLAGFIFKCVPRGIWICTALLFVLFRFGVRTQQIDDMPL